MKLKSKALLVLAQSLVQSKKLMLSLTESRRDTNRRKMRHKLRHRSKNSKPSTLRKRHLKARVQMSLNKLKSQLSKNTKHLLRRSITILMQPSRRSRSLRG
jgi:hypothetical protein